MRNSEFGFRNGKLDGASSPRLLRRVWLRGLWLRDLVSLHLCRPWKLWRQGRHRGMYRQADTGRDAVPGRRGLMRDRQRLDAMLDKPSDETGDLVLGQDLEDLSRRIQPLRDLPAPVAGDDRLEGWLPAAQRPPSAIAELQEIPETRRGQQARAGALSLQQGVRRDGRPMGDLGDLTLILVAINPTTHCCRGRTFTAVEQG